MQGRTALGLDQMPSTGLELVREFVHQAGLSDTRIADQVNQSAALEDLSAACCRRRISAARPTKRTTLRGLADSPGPYVIGACHPIGGNRASESLEGFETTIFEPNVSLRYPCRLPTRGFHQPLRLLPAERPYAGPARPSSNTRENSLATT